MGRFVVRDGFFKKAKDEGYRARSAYKLKEIQSRFHLVRRDDKVLDIGSAPGSWLQVISDVVGPQGLVVGLDILEAKPFSQKNVVSIRQDIRELDVSALMEDLSVAGFDAVTCDIAPNLTGIRDTDDRNVEELYDAVKAVVRKSLKKGGHFAFKAFYSEDFKGVMVEMNKMFRHVSVFKPTASRKGSSETYLVCTDRI